MRLTSGLTTLFIVAILSCPAALAETAQEVREEAEAIAAAEAAAAAASNHGENSK